MDGARDAVPDLPLRLEVRPERDDRAGQVAAGDGPGRREVGDVFPVGGVLPSEECQQHAAKKRKQGCRTLPHLRGVRDLDQDVVVSQSRRRDLLDEAFVALLVSSDLFKAQAKRGRVKMISEPTSSTVNARMVDGI